MRKKFLFSIQYASLCAFTVFLIITVMAKHYQFDSNFFVPLVAAFSGVFLTGWLTSEKQWKKYRHLKIGLSALLATFLLSWLGFCFVLMNHTGISFLLKGLAEAATSFTDGALIMIPAFILLVYLAEEKKQPEENTNNQGEETSDK